MSYSHMLFFHRTHEEEQGITFGWSFFYFQLTTIITHISTSHVIVWHIFVVNLTNTWSIWQSLTFKGSLLCSWCKLMLDWCQFLLKNPYIYNKDFKFFILVGSLYLMIFCFWYHLDLYTIQEPSYLGKVVVVLYDLERHCPNNYSGV